MRRAGQSITEVSAETGDTTVVASGSTGVRNSLAVALITTILSANSSLGAEAHADTTADLGVAVQQAHAANSCGALRVDPIANQSAQIINKSYSAWLDHTAAYPPITDALPGLKELGYRGNKAKYIGGASNKSNDDAIKGVLLEGFQTIPDCSYTDVGYNVIFNPGSGYYLAAAVFAGA